MVCSWVAAVDAGIARRDRDREGRGSSNRSCRYKAKGRRVANMRVGKPSELRVPAFPLLTASISEAELAKWFPVPLHHITHPQETAEPSKAALIRLDQGEYFVLYWGEWSKQLKLEIPSATNPSQFLDSFFREVPLPRTRIIWRRQDARLPRIAAKRISASIASTRSRPPKSTPTSRSSRAKARGKKT